MRSLCPNPITLPRLPGLVADQALRTPETVAVRCGTRALTYRELARRVATLADGLTDLGIGPGDLVSVRLPRTSDLVVALLAVLATGASYLTPDTVQHGTEAPVALVLNDLAMIGPVLPRRRTAPHRSPRPDSAALELLLPLVTGETTVLVPTARR
ncbi:acyl-CoA synthetase (AMP-forming)/AMP-acid ligase II [Crossiella equi]|uniref:Acyl-CoA synthetase (AMP-forming)/AMP-acid ligase II n=1 Tax=Crossiella equi TaxID=130796 RepID=A0ABS5A4S9_9PSEU|nr:AMP-binding protein [Crossiella equi]MBP2471589.1 acyl-CoA synthetase (AMP-forming)/AMP-acid ligase II [Crossiella equi]